MRNMSFSKTTQQMLAQTKTVTRRLGWLFLKPNNCLRAVEKGMGLKKGEKVKGLGYIKVVDVRREKLCQLTDNLAYGKQEVVKEGFPEMHPVEFVSFFSDSFNCPRDQMVTRIEFLHCIGAGKPVRTICICEDK